MVNYIIYFCCFCAGSILTIIALALVRGHAKNIVDEDPEKQELDKQWREQSKGY